MTGSTASATSDVSVSVVVPAFNARYTIVRAIDSALSQHGHAVEVIVVDDCSTDGTLELLHATYAGEPRMKVVRAAANGGPSRARNLGIGLAHGTWIGLLDGDDLWLPSRLDRLLSKASHADFIADNLLGYDAGADKLTGHFYRSIIESDTISLANLMSPPFNFNLATLKPLMRRSFLLQHGLTYPDHVRYGEDLLLYARALAAGARFSVIADALYLYTTPVGKLSGTASPHSQTVKDSEMLAGELEMLAAEPHLSPAGRRVIRARACHVRRNPSLSAFIIYAQRRDLSGMLGTLARNKGLLIDIYSKIIAMQQTRKMARRARSRLPISR